MLSRKLPFAMMRDERERVIIDDDSLGVSDCAQMASSIVWVNRAEIKLLDATNDCCGKLCQRQWLRG